MQNHKNFYAILGITLIVFVSFFLFSEIIFKLEQPLIENDELKLLKQFFPDKLIVRKDDKDYYTIDGKDYYVKSMGDVSHDGSTEFVSMEIIQGQGKTYRFYKKTAEEYSLIGEEESLIWDLENERNEKMEFMLQDIIGNDISEIIIPFEENAKGNRWYQILMFNKEANKFVKIFHKYYLSDKIESIISFDEIGKEGDLIFVIDHGLYEKIKSYYSFDGNTLNFEKSAGAYVNPDIEEEYEYKEIGKDGNVVYKETRKGSVWTDSLSR